ncbi:MAG: aspartate aminotransferase family protein [Pseudomonadota bacterium]
MSALMETYARLPVTFSHGEGIYLYDTDGKRYLDALAGIAVNGLGHAHPAVTAAISAQAGQLIHTSNLYRIGPQEALADALTEVGGMENCFFGNSGAEANEAAIKLARLYGHQQGVDRPAIVVLEGAFHGRTLATLSATGNRKIQAGFEPLVSGFTRAPRNDLKALHQIAENNPDVVAVFLEPIQGEAGVYPMDSEYLQAVRALCDEHNWLFMLDEVQTGNARTGTYFAYQAMDFVPDVITTAKGLGNGVPIGACLARGKAAHVLGGGQHGSTYGGNPLACATALAVVRTLVEEELGQNASHMGKIIVDELHADSAAADNILEVRGRGLMLGITLKQEAKNLVHAALETGLLINMTSPDTVRILPPLIISEQEARDLASRLCTLLRASQ